MSTPEALHAQIAQRLFGWTYASCGACAWCADGSQRWHGPDGYPHPACPAYSTDPAATAQVWQWLERQGAPLDTVHFEYQAMEEEGICCTVQLGRWDCEGYGTAWPAALCRAALALAEAREGETP